mgnify:CR=1 FL=1
MRPVRWQTAVMTFPPVPEHPSDQGLDGDPGVSGVSGASGDEADGGDGAHRSAELAGSAGGVGAYAVNGTPGTVPGSASSAPLSGYPGGMPSGPYGASYPAGPQVPGNAPIAYAHTYGHQYGPVPGRRPIPRQPSRAGLFVILAALLTCQLAFPFLSSIGSYAGFSLIDMVYRFVFSSMTWIVVVGIVQAVKRRPIPSFIPAAAMSVASSVFDLVLVVAYAGGHTFLSAVTNASFFLISLIEVCLFMIAGWMSCTRLRGRPGSPPISVLLSSGAAQFLLVLAAGRLVNAPVLLLMSGVGAPFDQYGADMRLGYGLYWYANSQPVGGAVPFGVGLAILIVVGLAAAGAVVMSRPGGSRVTLVAGSAVASGIFFLHSLYATILTFLAELHDRGGSLVIMGYTVPLVIAAALMIGMSLAGLAPSARAWFAGQRWSSS